MRARLNAASKEKNLTGITDIIEGKMVVNSFNDPSIIDDVLITKDEIKSPLIFPIGSTPQNIYFSSKKINPEPLYNTVQTLDLKDPKHGGISHNHIDDTDYFVPASPNIVLNIYNQNFCYIYYNGTSIKILNIVIQQRFYVFCIFQNMVFLRYNQNKS